MTSLTPPRRSKSAQVPPVPPVLDLDPAPQPEPEPSPPTGKIFLGEEDRRLLKKLSAHLTKKLDLGGNRSVKM